MTYLIVYLVFINLISFLLMGNDKSRARRHDWRISETTLMLLATIYGSMGMLLGMYFFHHKTKHMKFVAGVPLILLLQLAFGWYVLSVIQ